jgi:hypothetical protein
MTGINDWIVIQRGARWPLLEGVDRHSEEWIVYRSWLHTHPSFLRQTRVQNRFLGTGHYERENPKILTDHWFKYELALAYPTLYGKNGWANSLKQ